jgi:hypothetical protein
MGKYAEYKTESRTPFLEKELALAEDIIFFVTGVRESAADAPEKKWYLDIQTVNSCTCYGTWEKQKNGVMKLIRATEPISLLTISFKSLPYRDKNMDLLKAFVSDALDAGQVGYGPMRLVQTGKAIDPDDADDMEGVSIPSAPVASSDELEEAFP